MGFGAPAALGAKVAQPDKVVVSLVGDGDSAKIQLCLLRQLKRIFLWFGSL